MARKKVKTKAALAKGKKGKAVANDNSIDDAEISNTPPQQPEDNTNSAITLTDLPLELLYIIFDFAASRNHLGYPYYPLVVERRDGYRRHLVNFQHPLLVVCSQLRAQLVPYFYSNFSFHMELDMRLRESKSVNSIQALRKFWDAWLCNLDSLNLTVSMASFGPKPCSWTFVELAMLFYDNYCRSKNTRKSLKPVHMRLHVGNQPYRSILPWDSWEEFEEDLQELLETLHDKARDGVADPMTTRSDFRNNLEKWLDKDQAEEPSSCRMRKVIQILNDGKGNWSRCRIRINKLYK